MDLRAPTTSPPIRNARPVTKQGGIIPWLGLVIALCASCQQLTGPVRVTQISPVPINSCRNQGINYNNGNAFVVQKLQMLSSVLVPSSPPISDPPSGTSAAGTIYAVDVAAAFAAAPQWFQDQLCDLTMIYINPNPPSTTDGIFFELVGISQSSN